MSQHVKTYAPGTRVQTIPDEIVTGDTHTGVIGTVDRTVDNNGRWTIWVQWDDEPPGEHWGYIFEQLEAVDE